MKAITVAYAYIQNTNGDCIKRTTFQKTGVCWVRARMMTEPDSLSVAELTITGTVFLQATDARGDPQHPALTAVIKMILSVFHGQADVARGFSWNKITLVDWSLTREKVLRAIHTAKNVIAVPSGNVGNIYMTPALLKIHWNAYRFYKLRHGEEIGSHSGCTSRQKPKHDEESVGLELQAKLKLLQRQKQTESLISELLTVDIVRRSRLTLARTCRTLARGGLIENKFQHLRWTAKDAR